MTPSPSIAAGQLCNDTMSIAAAGTELAPFCAVDHSVDTALLAMSTATQKPAVKRTVKTPAVLGAAKNASAKSAVSAKPAVSATPVPTAKPAAPVIAPADLEVLFQQHAATHGVSAEIMKKIAQCESGMRPGAVNGPYGGMFQFVSSTWSSNRRAMGKDPDPALRFNAAEAIETAAFKMGRDGYGAWPACSRKALASV